MPRYRYLGDPTAIALPTKEGEAPQEVQLVTGGEVELPVELPYVQRLVEKGTLELIPAEPKKVRKASEGGDTA